MSSMRDVAEQVAAKYGLTLAELRGPLRTNRIARPRQEAMSLIYATGRFSTTQIGRFFGRDHTTVVHARAVHAARNGL